MDGFPAAATAAASGPQERHREDRARPGRDTLAARDWESVDPNSPAARLRELRQPRATPQATRRRRGAGLVRQTSSFPPLDPRSLHRPATEKARITLPGMPPSTV